MIYYTVAQKVSETYGQGDFGEEFHIIPINAHHTNSKKFYPIFTSTEKLLNWVKEEKKNVSIDSYVKFEIVELEVYS